MSVTGRRLHLVGMGGAGMSAYALAADALGAHVTGSDRAWSPYAERLLEQTGIRTTVGHRAENVPDGDDVEVVHSTAIPPDNPERVAARERGLPDRPRADLLGEIAATRRVIAVAGAHGKTTTAAMVAVALRDAGLDPAGIVGGEVRDMGALAGADADAAIAALATFTGAGRRFEELGSTPTGARIVDDYAHHPTEVAATIAAARSQDPARVVAVFQPHLYSRTRELAGAFGD